MPTPTPGPSSSTAPAPMNVLTGRPAHTPQARPTGLGVGWIVLALIFGIPAILWAAGVRAKQFFGDSQVRLETVTIDRGDLRSYVVEGGSLESADKSTVRCEVEAVLGTVTSGGQAGAQGGRGGAQAGGGGTVATAGSPAATKTAAAPGTAAAGKSANAAQAVAAGQSSANAQAQAVAASSSASAGNIIQKPAIKSFTMVIAPHTPLRPTTAVNAAKGQQNLQQMMDQQNGGNQEPQKQGSTTILRILPEGTPVQPGDIVCWLDASKFEDELKSQMIRYAQAKSWVEQAEYAYKSVEIALQEYKDGVYPQDLMLIDQYIHTCKISLKQAQDNLNWEHAMQAKSLRSDSQVKGAGYAFQRAELALKEAENMRTRLVKYTAPKLITNLEAKLEAVKSDREAQRAAFALEDQRKKKLERAIANCTMEAPRKGFVVYYVKSNGWGSVENEIAEGVTVRENEPVFLVPDPSRMRVVVNVNESKVAYLHRGLPALVRVEAFADQVLHGRVLEVTAIPTPAAGPFSDVKMYNATVEIESEAGMEGLRTGMNARVEFLVADRTNVVRVPIKTLRWFDGYSYVAVPSGTNEYLWKPITLGMMNEFFAEVVDGLEPGDQVVADPSNFDPPSYAERQRAKVASEIPEPGMQG